MSFWQGWMGAGLSWGTNLMAERSAKAFDAQTEQAGEVNRAFLLSLLKQNANTAFGQRFEFASISDADEFRRRLPLSTYDDYEADVARIAEGEQNVLCAEPIIHLGLSSGTTGKQKRIPISRSGQKQMALTMMFLTQGLLLREVPAARKAGRGVLLMNATTSGTTSGGISTGAGTSSGMRSMLKVAPLLWTSPVEAFGISHQPESAFLHLLFALREPNTGFVTAPFSSALVEMFHVLERHGDWFVSTFRTGKLPSHLSIPPELRAALEARLTPDEALASRLAQALEQGMAGFGKRWWPNLQYAASVIGGSFQVYGERLKFYLGDVPIHSSVYGATEALIGVAPKVETPVYAITPDSSFFEFIPIEKADDLVPQTLLLDEVEVGKLYELVITNRAGLYRYKLGDVVQVVGHYRQTPLVEFKYRKGQLLNVSGEKTLELAVLQAVLRATREAGIPLLDFSTRPDLDTSPGRYCLYLELPEGISSSQLAFLTRSVDSALGLTNPRYKVAREDGRLSAPLVIPVQPSTFQLVRLELVRKGASSTQVKVPRLLSRPELIELVESRRQEVLEG